MLEPIAISLTALYLNGIERPFKLVRRRWSRIVTCLRIVDGHSKSYPDQLRKVGFHEEALILETDQIMHLASELYTTGQVLTALDDAYPKRWIERLKESAPPALWIAGDLTPCRYIGIVGSRDISVQSRDFAIEAGKEAVRLGYGVVSGGAVGSDLAGVKGALQVGGQVLELLPYGIERFAAIDKAGLSLAAPNDEFSISLAMERNTLIYSASEVTVIIDARFKEGGTWHGAIEANRRKLCPLIVQHGTNEASRALQGLGCIPLSSPSELASALARPSEQRGLFKFG